MTWVMDFQFDTIADGRTLKMLNVIDGLTRVALAIHVGRSIAADGVVDVLDHLARQLGAPAYVRFVNGRNSCPTPSTTGADSTAALLHRPRARGARTPGRIVQWSSLTQSVEFDSLLEARVIIGDRRGDYNAQQAAHRPWLN